MKIPFKPATRIAAIALAVVYTGLTFGALASPIPLAARSVPQYAAELAAPAKEPRLVAGGIAWSCEGTVCRASDGASRPLRLCRSLQRKLGEVVSFTTNGAPIDPDELERCNR